MSITAEGSAAPTVERTVPENSKRSPDSSRRMEAPVSTISIQQRGTGDVKRSFHAGVRALRAQPHRLINNGLKQNTGQ